MFIVKMAEPALTTIVKNMSPARHFLVLVENRPVFRAKVVFWDNRVHGTDKLRSLQRFSRIFTGCRESIQCASE
jgi:hypothetical protein